MTHDTPPPAPEPSVLDAGALAQLREIDPAGRNQLVQRVVAAYESSLARLRPQLEAARAAGDLDALRQIAHTLKSSSASVGALKLSRLCADIEAMIRDGGREGLDAKLDAMRLEAGCALEALKGLPEARA